MKKLFILFILLISCTIYNQTGKEYYNSGLQKHQNGYYYDAIDDYTKSIELNPGFVYAYFNRGVAKEKINDLNGACEDYKIAAKMGHKGAQEIVYDDHCN